MPAITRDMMEIARVTTQYRSEKLAPLGLKSCHSSYLLAISNHPGISQDQLAQMICINKSNVARQVVVLEESGFITRSPNPSDKRGMQLYPTEKTLEILPQIRQVNRFWQEYLTGDLTQQELEVLESLLRRIQAKAAAWTEET